MATDATPFSLPITIGVTGHRDIAPSQIAEIEKSVASVLEGVRARAPRSRLLLLTSLAEGADRLVTKVAVEKFGADYVAVLPRAADSYRHDFETAESQAEFDRLLGAARRVIVANGDPAPPGNSAPDQRRDEYAYAGYWVSLHSHLLLALWDSKEARGGGGTAEVVAARLKGRYPGLNDDEPLQYAEGGAVAQIVTARAGETAPAASAAVKWRYPEVDRQRSENAAKPFGEVLAAVDRLNRLAARDGRTLAAWSRPHEISHVAALKALADHMAQRFQRRVHVAVKSLTVATVAAALAGLLDGLIGQIGATILTTVALVGGGAIWLGATFAKWQLLHVDFRALAEGARVQLAWTASGQVVCVSDHYHPVQASDIEWLRRALRTAWMLDMLEARAARATADQRRANATAAVAWIDEQIEYFLGNKGVVAKYRRQGRVFAILAFVCLGAGLAMLSAGKLLDMAHIGSGLESAGIARLAKVALAATASLQAYQAFMGFKDLERSFSVTAHLFRIVNDSVRSAEQAGDYGRLAFLTRAIGRAALVENVEWLILKRQRRPKPPVG